MRKSLSLLLVFLVFCSRGGAIAVSTIRARDATIANLRLQRVMDEAHLLSILNQDRGLEQRLDASAI